MSERERLGERERMMLNERERVMLSERERMMMNERERLLLLREQARQGRVPAPVPPMKEPSAGKPEDARSLGDREEGAREDRRQSRVRGEKPRRKGSLPQPVVMIPQGMVGVVPNFPVAMPMTMPMFQGVGPVMGVPVASSVQSSLPAMPPHTTHHMPPMQPMTPMQPMQPIQPMQSMQPMTQGMTPMTQGAGMPMGMAMGGNGSYQKIPRQATLQTRSSNLKTSVNAKPFIPAAMRSTLFLALVMCR